MKKIKTGENPIDVLKEDLENHALVAMILLKGTDVKNQEIRFFNTYEIIPDSSFWLFHVLNQVYFIVANNSTKGIRRRDIKGLGDPFSPENTSYYSPINTKTSKKIVKYLQEKISESKSDRDTEIINRFINALNDKADGILISSLIVEIQIE